MRRRNLLAALVVVAICQMAFRCPIHRPSIEIHSPAFRVDSFDFVVEIEQAENRCHPPVAGQPVGHRR